MNDCQSSEDLIKPSKTTHALGSGRVVIWTKRNLKAKLVNLVSGTSEEWPKSLGSVLPDWKKIGLEGNFSCRGLAKST
jgi:hypothetical protein